MDDKSFNIRVPKKWARVGMVALVTALIVAPLTAIAAHTFTDVPDSNTFHEDIAWLKDAGVTLGCNPPTNTQFCPKDEVTREQMSAFMRRLAENKVVDAATAVQAENATTADDADTVNGKSAADLTTTLNGLNRNSESLNSTPLAAVDDVTVLEKSLPNSAGDYALVTYGFTAQDTAGVINRTVGWLQVDDTDCTLPGLPPYSQILDGSIVINSMPANQWSSTAGSIVVPTSGDPTLTLCVRAVSGTASLWDASLNSVHTDSGSANVVNVTGGQSGTSELFGSSG
ncbi:MAG: S-layer homology domain-containing protein [Acidimicrobiia bacterium]|jgi:hypothetical protein